MNFFAPNLQLVLYFLQVPNYTRHGKKLRFSSSQKNYLFEYEYEYERVNMQN